jgi:hypothetical protein
MGFLSKLMKNPIVQMALPMALTAVAGPAFGALGSKFSLFNNMSPLMANALKQTALGYGTAALSGSKRPGKAAMAAGLTSIPFSYLSAANAAKGFNAANAASTQEAMVPRMGSSKIPFDQVDVDQGFFMPSTMQKQMMVPGTVPYTAPQLSPMDIMLGRVPEGVNMVGPTSLDAGFGNEASGMPGYARSANPQATGLADEFIYAKQLPGEKLAMPSADIFSKPEMMEVVTADPLTGLTQKQMRPTGTFKTDFLPTAVSQAAGLYAGRDTPEEEFEAAKRRRRKELAFLYGVDESLIEGEMDNPFYTGAMMNAGGIASLNMDMGGNVSGPGGPKDDMIDAKLSDGEFVMTAKAVENFGNGSRMEGAKKMYQMMNKLDPESETMSEV